MIDHGPLMATRKRLAILLSRVRSKSLTGQLARGGVGSVAIKIANTLLGLALAIALARVLGPEGFGIYSYVFALVSILAVPAQFGLPKLVVRETAKAQVNEEWGRMLGVWRWATSAVVLLSVAIAIMSLGVAWLLAGRFSGLQLGTFVWGLILMPLAALARLRGAALQGLRHVVLGELPESVLRPALLIFFISIFAWWGAGGQLTAASAMSLHVLAAAIAFAFGAWLLYRRLPEELSSEHNPIYEPRKWLSAAWPLALVASMQQINTYTDIVILGIFVSAEEVGVYRVAVQGAMLAIFGLQAVAMIVSPYFARLYTQNDIARLQHLVTASARIAFFTAFPLAIIFVVMGDEILRSLFGENYVGAYIPMIILVVGQTINALFGPVGILLSMTGHERDAARGVTIAACTNVVLNLLLIPQLGMNGAAIATALTLAIWNILLWFDVRRRLNVDCMAIRFHGQ